MTKIKKSKTKQPNPNPVKLALILFKIKNLFITNKLPRRNLHPQNFTYFTDFL